MEIKDRQRFWEYQHKEQKISTLSDCSLDELLSGLYLSDYIAPGIKLLEVGVGTGKATKQFNDLGCEVSAIDISTLALNKVQSFCKGTYHLSEMSKLPVNYFDVIIMSNVVQHTPTNILIPQFMELLQSLKPEGVFALQFITCGETKDNGEEVLDMFDLGCYGRSLGWMEETLDMLDSVVIHKASEKRDMGTVTESHIIHVTKKETSIKYSILIPYYDRHLQFLNTLYSFMQYADRKDFEVIVVEDFKNTQDPIAHELLTKALEMYEVKFPITHLRFPDNTYNPAPLYNLAAKVTKGRYFIITSPECFHDVDILQGLDQQFETTPEGYVVCACKATDMEGEFLRWYQHSEHKNSRYHFCSAISKANWKKIGGFDKRYGEGYCFDDDDFRDTIIQAGIPVICRDDLMVTHQWHSKTYRPPNHKRLWDKNKALYISKFDKYQSYL